MGIRSAGSLGGAGGTYRCAANGTMGPECTVQNTGSQLIFSGPWTFRPSSSARVQIEDGAFMHFGWWSRQVTGTDTWSFKTFHGRGGDDVYVITDVSAVTGSATYRGPAVGYYAIYEPVGAGSEYGAFTATAELTADFDSANNTVNGTIDQFSGHPDWSLALEGGVITGGSTGPANNTVHLDDRHYSRLIGQLMGGELLRKLCYRRRSHRREGKNIALWYCGHVLGDIRRCRSPHWCLRGALRLRELPPLS